MNTGLGRGQASCHDGFRLEPRPVSQEVRLFRAIRCPGCGAGSLYSQKDPGCEEGGDDQAGNRPEVELPDQPGVVWPGAGRSGWPGNRLPVRILRYSLHRHFLQIRGDSDDLSGAKVDDPTAAVSNSPDIREMRLIDRRGKITGEWTSKSVHLCPVVNIQAPSVERQPLDEGASQFFSFKWIAT